MSRRTKQQQAGSRRTRRAEQQPHAEFGFTETQRVVLSNPIFYCGGNGGPSQQSKPPGDQLRCVHDPAAGSSGIGKAKPLPLPPCRAYHRGARVGPAPAVVVGGPHGRLLRRAYHHQHDPFLAAYVACSKSSGGENGARVKRKHEKKKTSKGEKGDVVRGCGGIWEGWAASAKYAGAAMSCKNVCAVVDVRATDALVAKAKEDKAAGPTLDLSWAPVVLSARAMERRKEQR